MACSIIIVRADAQSVAQAAVDLIVVAAGGVPGFSIALSGGSTPRTLYELLAQEPYRSQINWSDLQVFFGDERCVPPDHPDSNYRMARDALLTRVPIPEQNVHRMKGELEPQIAAAEYGRMLKQKFGDGGLDIVLLGMGDDGHTASLFPGTEALSETEHRCVANYVEKFKSSRITLTAPFINRSRQVLVLVSGASKAARVKEVLEGPHDPQRLPIQLIQPTNGSLTWLLDVAAAGMNADDE